MFALGVEGDLGLAQLLNQRRHDSQAILYRADGAVYGAVTTLNAIQMDAGAAGIGGKFQPLKHAFFGAEILDFNLAAVGGGALIDYRVALTLRSHRAIRAYASLADTAGQTRY